MQRHVCQEQAMHSSSQNTFLPHVRMCKKTSNAHGRAGLQGLDGAEGGAPDMGSMMQMLQQPGVQQAMQSLMSQPQVIRNMMDSNPQMRAMMDQNPQVRCAHPAAGATILLGHNRLLASLL